jgi:predicted nucleic acid-binding protein
MYLLDTNIVSELRKGKKADGHVLSWAKSVTTSSLFLSVISILEIEAGVLQKEHKDPFQGAILRSWLDAHVLPAFADRMLNVDVAVALRCAKLHIPDKCSERDALIAATALVHGLIVVTRNIKDFNETGVEVLNPWD